MCGIIGYEGPWGPVARHLVATALKSLSHRGRHATGVAVLFQGSLTVLSSPVPAEQFLTQFPLPSDDFSGHVCLIGHTRYSTSSLDWNMPLTDGDRAFVLNGVVTQDDVWPEPPDGEPYQTGNDAEIAFKFSKLGRIQETPGSWAALEIAEGKVCPYRNGERPLYKIHNANATWYCSTRDVVNRAGIPGEVSVVPPYTAELQPVTRYPYPLRCRHV